MGRNNFDRRKFLTAVSVSAGTLVASGLTGCGSSSDEPSSGSPPLPPPPTPQIVSGTGFYPQSVASGDPRPDQVILWTRVENGSGDLAVTCQVARDENFNDLVVDIDLSAPEAHDHCLKVRVTDLDADSRYFYRFLHLANGNFQASRTGRTRTAPAVSSQRDIRFAQVSCQDYVGRYYNTYLKLLDEDLDFVLHLGDYVYETTGDPRFQQDSGPRQMTFRAPEEAIDLGGFLAAQSVGNYRDLYRTVRSDSVLQQINERFPIVAVWDDHEFADDSWGATANDFNGRVEETSVARKRNAESVYFEYMPVDPLGGTQQAFFDDDNRFPETRLYRELRFGANVHLLLTDYRTYRPDHLIPEDAFPGAIAVDQNSLIQVLAGQGVDFSQARSRFEPYIDIDRQPFSALKPVVVGVLTQAYQGEGLDPSAAQAQAIKTASGNLAISVVNSLIDAFNATVESFEQAPVIDAATIADAPRGLAFFAMGKTELFSSFGSRVFVVKDTFDLYAAAKYFLEGRSTQDAYGPDQEMWLRNRVQNSNARWTFVANSCSNTPLVLDLANPQLGVPEPFNQRFYLNVDQWDGFPDKRRELLSQVYQPANGTILLAGDIHASSATDHGADTFEFTVSSVSSSTFGSIVARAVADNANLSQFAGPLLPLLDAQLQLATPQIQHLQSSANGVNIVTARPDDLRVSYFELPEDQVFINRYDDPQGVVADMSEIRYRVDVGGLTRLT